MAPHWTLDPVKDGSFISQAAGNHGAAGLASSGAPVQGQPQLPSPAGYSVFLTAPCLLRVPLQVYSQQQPEGLIETQVSWCDLSTQWQSLTSCLAQNSIPSPPAGCEALEDCVHSRSLTSSPSPVSPGSLCCSDSLRTILASCCLWVQALPLF